MLKANNNANGITDAVIKPALQLPNSSNRIKITMSAPSTRFVVTVPIALSTNFDLSKNYSITTPSGNVLLIVSILSFTSVITFAEFAPFSIITIALTTSPSPLRVVAP